MSHNKNCSCGKSHKHVKGGASQEHAHSPDPAKVAQAKAKIQSHQGHQ